MEVTLGWQLLALREFADDRSGGPSVWSRRHKRGQVWPGNRCIKRFPCSLAGPVRSCSQHSTLCDRASKEHSRGLSSPCALEAPHAP